MVIRLISFFVSFQILSKVVQFLWTIIMACSHQLHRFLLLLLLPFSAFLFSLFFPLASASLSSVSSVFSAPRLVLSCFSYFSVFLALVGCEVLCCFVFTLKVCFFGVHRNCWIIFYVLDCVKMFIVMGI